MGAEYDYFQSIPLDEFEFQRHNVENRVRRLDVLHEAGLIVEAYSTNRTMMRRSEAVHFMAEVSHIDPRTMNLGYIGIELTIFSHADLSPYPGSTQHHARVYSAPASDNNGVTEWVFIDNNPLRTIQFGALRTGFFTYWGDDNILLVDEYPQTPPETQL